MKTKSEINLDDPKYSYNELMERVKSATRDGFARGEEQMRQELLSTLGIYNLIQNSIDELREEIINRLREDVSELKSEISSLNGKMDDHNF